MCKPGQPCSEMPTVGDIVEMMLEEAALKETTNEFGMLAVKLKTDGMPAPILVMAMTDVIGVLLKGVPPEDLPSVIDSITSRMRNISEMRLRSEAVAA